MNYFDNEENTIEWFQTTVHKGDVIFPVSSFGAKRVFKSIFKPRRWKFWKSSNGKNDPPPDFYSEKNKFMMEVMRVDDHSRLDQSQKWVNPTNRLESQIQKELRTSGFFNSFPKVANVFVNAVTDLPANEDHNYQFYYSGFRHTLKKHIKKIPLYRKNHPGYKVVFFVFDESSAYVQVNDKELINRGMRPGEAFDCQIHPWFIDKRFVDAFRNADIDYLIWYSPFKHIDLQHPIRIPSVCVYDLKKWNGKYIQDFSEEYIISSEC